MKCDRCDKEMVERLATVESPYAYDLSGLKGISLCGITVRRCPQCGSESPKIPRIEELHRVVSEALFTKPSLLRGEELRFLRKNAGLSAKRFSALLDIDPSHLSRFENGKRKFLGPPTDKLARFLAMAAIDQEFLQKVLSGIADQRMEAKKKVSKPPKPVFQLVRNHWKSAA